VSVNSVYRSVFGCVHVENNLYMDSELVYLIYVSGYLFGNKYILRVMKF
jgi:hypothetical protein